MHASTAHSKFDPVIAMLRAFLKQFVTATVPAKRRLRVAGLPGIPDRLPFGGEVSFKSAADEKIAAQPYRVIRVTEEFESPLIENLWGQMLVASKSEEKIYQSPQFFQFVSETAEVEAERAGLFALQRCVDGEIIGIVPVRMRSVAIGFRLTRRASLSVKVPTIMLLGSVLMVAREFGSIDYLIAALLDHYPHCRAASMPACPVEYFDEMNLGPASGKHLTTYVLNGWQDCHTIPLPASFDEYTAKLSAKKRYNLTRQIRQLAQQVGPLQLHRMDLPERVPALRQALRGLMTQKEFDATLSEVKWRALAARGLLLCYTVTGGDDVVAAIVGTRANGVWHVHNILCDRKYQHLSPGTSAMHLALQDAIDNLSLACADLGYGKPKQEFRSTHVLRSRGHVLFAPRLSLVRWLFAAHRTHAGVTASMLRAVAGLKCGARTAGAAIRRLAPSNRNEPA